MTLLKKKKNHPLEKLNLRKTFPECSLQFLTTRGKVGLPYDESYLVLLFI